MFPLKSFRNPESRFSPGYFWCIGYPMEPEELERQLEEMAAHGVKSVCLHPVPREFRWTTEMSPDYLSEEFHAIVTRLVRKASALGMNYYLYDEGGWPSGSACGQVVASNPERFSRSCAESDGKGGFRIVRIKPHPEVSAPVPDVLVPGATEKFLELTHQAYFEHWGEEFFGTTVRFAFTDEPMIEPRNTGRLGWTADLPEEFLRRKGYRLEPFVPALLSDRHFAVASPEARAAADYREVMGQLFVERYLLPIREWCRKHKLISCGHFSGEDEWFIYHRRDFGVLTQSLRALDMPGVDMIWRQLYPGRRLHPYPKLASSAAHQNGTRAVLGELFAVYGSGITPAVMKYLVDYMAVCGVNTFVFSNISQKIRDGGMSGCRPHFGPADPLWPLSRPWHEYVARLSAAMNRGKSVCDTALYFDERAMAVGGREEEYAVCRGLKIADMLLESQNEFDYIGDAMLASARIRKGCLAIGRATYRRVVVPPCSFLSDDARRQLERFRAVDGEVLNGEEPELTASPLLKVDPPSRSLRVTKRDLGGGEMLYFVFNTSQYPVSARLATPESGPLATADPESGELYAITAERGVWHWDFRPWESRCFISGHRTTLPLPPGPGRMLAELDGARWRLKAQYRRVAGKHELLTLTCEDIPERKVRLGDWRKALGAEFSGEAIYRCSFRYDAEGGSPAFLDLGRVCWAARVFLNGHDLGIRLWSPFVFRLDGALKRGTNRLEVRVSNTLANALSGEELQEYWRQTFPPESPYECQQRAFERDTLESGLFGPVRLLAEAPRRPSVAHDTEFTSKTQKQLPASRS